MKIIIIRHPQTTANQKKIIYGKNDYPYTQPGFLQIEHVLKYVTTTTIPDRIQVFSSPANRALGLAEPIAGSLDVPLQIEERLGEMNFGIFEGLTHQEAEKKYPSVYEDFLERFELTCIPGGESYSDFQQRVHAFVKMVQTIEATDTVDTCIIVTHGAVIREMLEKILELNPGGSWKFQINNGTIVELEKKTMGFVIQQILQVRHDEGED